MPRRCRRRRLAPDLPCLIDADNVRAAFLPIIVREASALGTITVKRVYGHFVSTSMNAWHPLIHEYALTPVHVPPAATGKNATDMKLAIEAMDLLHRGQIEGFCIASSDSDFTTLASRIREDGVSVYGFGEQKASKAYVRSCDRFFYCDLLIDEEKGGSRCEEGETCQTARRRHPRRDRRRFGREGWAHLGPVGQILTKRLPDFDPRNHGFKQLSSLIESMKSVEVRRRKTEGRSFVEVRVKPPR